MQGGGCLAWRHVGSPQPPGVIPEHHQTWQQNQKEKNNTKARKGRPEEVCGVGGGQWFTGPRVWG